MRHFFLFITLIISSLNIKAEINPEEFYLSDSVFTETLSKTDNELLKTKLDLYHKSKEDTSKINALIELVEYCEDITLMSIYNNIILELIEDKLNSNPLKKEKLKLDKMKATTFNNIGYCYHISNKPLIGLDYYFKALKIQQQCNLIDGMVNSYVNIGTTYYDLKNIKKSLAYFLKAYEKKDKIKNLELKGFLLNNIGVIYSDQRDIPKSLIYQLESLEIRQNLNDSFGIAMSYNNIGGSYFLMDSLEKGMEYLNASLNLFLNLKEDRWISLTYRKMGVSFLKFNNIKLAYKNALKALEYGYKSERIDAIERAERLISQVYREKGDFKNAFKHYQTYISLRDSISNEKNRTAALQKELEFEYEKQKEIDKKEKEKIIAIVNSEKQQQKIINYSFGFGLTLTIIFLVFLIHRLYLSRKQNTLIQKQSDERKLLLKEIHHRVKNNFQIISSILRLQANDEKDEKIKIAFDDAINRIHSMAEVHELIYKNEVFSEVDTNDYLQRLISSIKSSLNNKIEFIIESEDSSLNFETLIPLGITINELITNSIKYAFNQDINNPTIKINLAKTDNEFIITYKDNGKGLSQEEQKLTFGMELVETIINQIEGKITIGSSEKWKNTITISFKN